MKRYVMWSGGLDSTLALIMTIHEFGLENTVAVSIAHEAVGAQKLKNELQARDALLKVIQRNWGWQTDKLERVHMVIDGEISLERWPEHRAAPQQATLWLGSVLHLVEDGADIAFGYIRGDDYWYHKANAEAVVDAFALLDGMEKLTVSYPVRRMTKAQILHTLTSFDPELISSAWWCEGPEEGDIPVYGSATCGSCKPCDTHAAALDTAASGPPCAVRIREMDLSIQLEKIRGDKETWQKSSLNQESNSSESQRSNQMPCTGS